MKRTLAYLLLISMLASLTACGGEAASDDTTAPGAADTTAPVTEAETDRSEITDDLPATDLGGYKFRIIGRNDILSTNTSLARMRKTAMSSTMPPSSAIRRWRSASTSSSSAR